MVKLVNYSLYVDFCFIISDKTYFLFFSLFILKILEQFLVFIFICCYFPIFETTAVESQEKRHINMSICF